MPKVDCLVNGTLDRAAILQDLRLDDALPTVLYAPTWSPASSLNAMGLDLVRALVEWPVNVIVKLHDRSRDLRVRSGPSAGTRGLQGGSLKAAVSKRRV